MKNEGFQTLTDLSVVAFTLGILLTLVSCDSMESEAAPCEQVGCSYIPAAISSDTYPEMTVFDACACLYPNGSLNFEQQHLGNLDFDSGGLAAVHVHQIGFVYVDASGKNARTLPFDNGPDYFVDGLARTLVEGKIGFINKDLDTVIEPVWDFAFPFERGLAMVCTDCRPEPTSGEHSSVEGGLWGYIDTQGQMIVPVEYDRTNLPARADLDPP